MLKILVASQSPIKVQAVEEVMNSFITNKGAKLGKKDLEIKGLKVQFVKQCPQPFDDVGGQAACEDRIEWILSEFDCVYEYDFIISIENYIKLSDETDRVCIILHDVSENCKKMIHSSGIPLPDSHLMEKPQSASKILQKLTLSPEYRHALGATKTYGELFNQEHPEIPADNWMAYAGDHKYRRDRKTFIKVFLGNLLEQAFPDMMFLHDLKLKFRQYDDFPIKGIKFEDWSDIFLDSDFLQELIDYLAKQYSTGTIQYVMGLESRGYFLAVALAMKLKAGFVPIKKAGKTPGETVIETYMKEYGSDCLELRSDLKPGNVLIVDDVLATGGSLEAAIKLCHRVGHTVIESITIKDIPPLRKQAREKLKGESVRVLLT